MDLDKEAIENGKLHLLPCEISARNIVADFISQNPNLEKSILNILSDLLLLFNLSVGRLLLYSEESLQFLELLKLRDLLDLDFSDIYGGTHLLRFLVSLPEVMSISKITSSTERKIYAITSKLVNHFQNQITTYLTPNYFLK